MEEETKDELSGWFEIFRTGAWNGGKNWEGDPYEKEDLDKMVENFGSGRRDVPLVLGHWNPWVEGEKPALGWVAELKRVGNRLMAKAKDVTETLKTLVNEKRYPKRSVEIYENLDGKGMTLSAVAFLGASQPAVPGMADFQFSVTTAGTVGGAVRRMVYTPDDSGVVTEDDGRGRVTESSAAKPLGEDRAQPSMRIERREPEGGEEMDEKERARLREELLAELRNSEEFRALKAENEQLKSERDEAKRQAFEDANRSFADGLVTAKQLTPALGEKVAAFGAKLGPEHAEEFRDMVKSLAKDLGALFAEVSGAKDDAGATDGEGHEVTVTKPVVLSIGPQEKK